MRKTFLKVALIGLLATAMPAVVTSCKDYDNDIENLDSQVADLKTKLASVESAIAALPTKADVTAAQAAAVAQAKADLEAAKSQLQAAIDGKADKAAVEAINTELSTIKGQLEAIEALKGDVATALESINAAITDLKTNAVTKGQMDAALAAQKAELESYADGKVGTLVEDVEALQAAIDNSANDINAIKAQIEALANKINDATGGEGATSLEAVLRLMNGMITHIEVVNVAGNEDHRGYNSSLDLYTVTVAEDLVFGQGYASDGTGQLGFDKATFTIANQEVFKKGEVKTFTDSILIRVSPANAVVTADQIQLVNSQGADLNDYVQVTEVEAYKGLLTTAGSRSIANNGLHVVKFALKDAFDDVEGFINATDANNGEGSAALVQFAVAIADSEKELAEGREITSAYALTINATPNEPQYALDFDVVHNNVSTPVAQLRNRFRYALDQNNDNSSLMFPDFKDYETAMEEVYSKRVAQTNYSTAVTNGFTAVGDFAWVKNADEENVATYASALGNDDRTGYNLLEVKLGDEFTVDMSGYNVDKKTGIYGFYVTLDMWRATESNGSEREAWKSVAPSISGINAVTTGDKINISISKDAAVDPGEILGFRVYAVNYDGTLVDPDGRAFYVVVNKPVEAVATASAVINAPAASMSATAEVEGLGDWTATVPRVYVSFKTNGSIINGREYPYINNNPYLTNDIYVKVGNTALGNGWWSDRTDGDGNPILYGGYYTINRGNNGAGYDVLKKLDV
ncbi:MAG: hypothetical protein K2L63_03810 [Paramuribaculum sp.]|nr:hypothetical protein [Paramuribaculum sp.]